MPTYDYTCDKCKSTKEIIHSIHKNPVFKCEKCKSKLRREVGIGAFVATNMQGTLEDHKEGEYKKKTSDLERAIKKRKSLFGSSDVGSPVDKPNPKHIIRRGKHIAGQEQEVDKQEFIKAAAKDPHTVNLCKAIVDKKK